MSESNPNGANQYQLDPRQKMCWSSYINPSSETFGNATQSAIKAGYTPDYADQITTVDWFKGKVRRLNMVSKAERNLDNTLDLVTLNKEGYEDPQLLKIKIDVSKTIVQTLGKDEGYSTKTETDLTSKGEKIEFPTAINIIKPNDDKLLTE
jgi:hypothetical protein